MLVEDTHKPLRDDVRLLGSLLGETLIRREGEELYRCVERVRTTARRARRDTGGAAGAFRELSDELAALPLEAAVPVVRAFSHFLHLANVAEQHNRIRRRHLRQRDPEAAAERGSLDEALPRLAAIASPDQVYEAVLAMRIDLVMTAHPTEMVRRTLQRKYASIADALAALDRADVPRERQRVIETLGREIAAAWETEDVRSERPSATDEVRAAFAVFERTIWNAVPEYLRSLDRALAQATGRRLPLAAAPIRFGTWIGGDRDGNPSITPEVTRRACLHSRWLALTSDARDVAALGEDLSMTRASDALRACTAGSAEPYRALLRKVHRDLETTRRAIEDQLSTRPGGRGGPAASEILSYRRGSRAPATLVLRLAARDGQRHHRGWRARGRVAPPRLFRPDARQARRPPGGRSAHRSDRLDRAPRRPRRLRAMGRGRANRLPHRGAGGYRRSRGPAAQSPRRRRPADVRHARRDAARRPGRLRHHDGGLSVRRAGRRVPPTPRRHRRPVARRTALRDGARSARCSGRARSPSVDSLYRSRLAAAGDRQEVMIGYSDTAKEIGRLASAWELHQAQEAIVAACRRHGVAVTLFHGRGGTIGRGGGPTYLTLQTQPAPSSDGTLRVTEQGEMIQAKFGLPGTALRTLEVYTSSTLEAMLAPAVAVHPEWRDAMDRLTADARHAFRDVVYHDDRFPAYFRAVTPEAEIDSLHIGSRPARRGAGGLAGLRAIPWHFAWMQTRLLLASWLGADALGTAAEPDRRLYREMYREWPFFRSLIELLEIALGKADSCIAAEYDRRLAPEALRGFGAGLRDRLQHATAAVLAITGRNELLAGNEALRRSIEVRNPYVDPINLCQIELLQRLAVVRDDEAQVPIAAALRRALRITISGVAAGMRNTG